jgi:hypothetical protein
MIDGQFDTSQTYRENTIKLPADGPRTRQEVVLYIIMAASKMDSAL